MLDKANELTKPDKYHFSMPGSLSFSIEIELGWGAATSSNSETMQRFSDGQRTRETDTLESLLNVCDCEGIPLTFNVVGHLFLSECDNHDGPHRDGWFDMDPETNVSNNALFYAPDLIEMIDGAAVEHEICTHTFSHIPCDEVSQEVLEWELQTVQNTHEMAGLRPPESIVTPWHRTVPPDILKANGIETIRVPGDEPPEDSRISKFLWYLFRSPVVDPPEIVDELTNVYCSTGPSLSALHLPQGDKPPHRAFQVIPKTIRKRIHRRYLQQALKAAKRGKHPHLWTHLYDISNEDQWSTIKGFLRQVGNNIENGQISIMRLKDFNQEINDKE